MPITRDKILKEDKTGIEKRFRQPKASHEAAGTIQPHMLYARPEVRRLVFEKLFGLGRSRARRNQQGLVRRQAHLRGTRWLT